MPVVEHARAKSRVSGILLRLQDTDSNIQTQTHWGLYPGSMGSGCQPTSLAELESRASAGIHVCTRALWYMRSVKYEYYTPSLRPPLSNSNNGIVFFFFQVYNLSSPKATDCPLLRPHSLTLQVSTVCY